MQLAARRVVRSAALVRRPAAAALAGSSNNSSWARPAAPVAARWLSGGGEQAPPESPGTERDRQQRRKQEQQQRHRGGAQHGSSQRRRAPETPETPEAVSDTDVILNFAWDDFFDTAEKAALEWQQHFDGNSQVNTENKKMEALKKVAGNKRDTSLPLPRERKVDQLGRACASGSRKTARAVVWIEKGTGNVTVNKRELVDFFPVEDARFSAIEPLIATSKMDKFDVTCLVHGGGYTGQAGAIRLAVARALQNWDPELRKVLKPLKMLRRDPRMVERKKGGQPKARKKFQWVKR